MPLRLLVLLTGYILVPLMHQLRRRRRRGRIFFKSIFYGAIKIKTPKISSTTLFKNQSGNAAPIPPTSKNFSLLSLSLSLSLYFYHPVSAISIILILSLSLTHSLSFGGVFLFSYSFKEAHQPCFSLSLSFIQNHPSSHKVLLCSVRVAYLHTNFTPRFFLFMS